MESGQPRRMGLSAHHPDYWQGSLEKDIVVCRQRKVEENTVYAREIILSKQKGLIRDRTYLIRLYKSQDLLALLKHVGFESVSIHTDFPPPTGIKVTMVS